jgi:hypothetical protein
MHGGANELYSAMHGGGVQLPRGLQPGVPADVARDVERRTPPCIMAGYNQVSHTYRHCRIIIRNSIPLILHRNKILAVMSYVQINSSASINRPQ